MQDQESEGADPRILGARVREAREARDWTQKQVADRLGVARTTMVAIEKGERQLKAEELVALARVFDVSLSSLLQRTEPSENFAVKLRGALPPAHPQNDELLPHIEEFQRLSEDYAYLEELCGAPLRRRYPSLYEIEGVDPELAAEDVAVAERRRLDLGEGPLIHLREILENDVGLRIFHLDLPSSVAGIFAFTEELGACIALSSRQSAERRRQALAREYGHFLSGRFKPHVLYVGQQERRPAHERFMETFARSFLMPPVGVRNRYLEIQRGRKAAPTFGDLVRLAQRYKASVEAMTRRLEELRLVPADTWDHLKDKGFEVLEPGESLRLIPVRRDENMLPLRYRSLAVEAWQREKLSEGQLARLLRTDRLGAREIVQDFEGLAGDEADEDGTRTIDLAAPLLEAG